MTATLSRGPARQADQTFHHYRIIAADHGGAATAIAYAGMTRIDVIDADTVEAAVQVMEARLQQRLKAFVSERDAEGWPSVEEYRDVLLALPAPLKKEVTPVLKAHARLPEARTTVLDLARITGVDRAALFAGYRKLGRRLFLDLRLARHRPTPRSERFLLDPFAICDQETPAEYPIIQLRPAFVEALK